MRYFLAALAAALAASGSAAAQGLHRTTDATATYVVRFDHWTDADERDFGEFITAIGNSGCTTVNACLHDPGNPFQASDAPSVYFRSDCAKSSLRAACLFRMEARPSLFL